MNIEIFNTKVKNIAKNLTLAVGLGALIITTACGGKGPEGVVASVNGVEIKDEDFIVDYSAQRNYIVQMSGSEDVLKESTVDNPKVTIDEELRRQTLENLIQMELVKQDAQKKDIKVNQEEIDKQLEEVVNKSGGQEAYEEQLKKNGLSPAFFEKYLANNDLMSKYYEKLKEELKPTEENLKKYYEDNKDRFFSAKASHILVADVDEANKLKKELDKGADFAELAKENSIDPGTAEKGGELGEFTNGTMVKEFEDTIKVMKPGEISDPFKTDYGYHIVKLEEKSERAYADLKDELETLYIQEKTQEYLDKLEKDSEIKRYLDPKDEFELPAEYKIVLPEKTTEAPAEGTNEEAPATEKQTETPKAENSNETAKNAEKTEEKQ
ncbi:peptidyl-prolyl cis-trans isomerase [Peptoniphilus sp. ING2-D1G]|nr:peptidyl-prolyl cis-trans isomerase [Peptoniphilus sp. ING2-D1G]